MPELQRPATAGDPGDPGRDKRFRHQIEAGVSISGRIHFPEDARVDGLLKGEIRADHLLWVGETAELEATVSARHMVLAGTLRGDVIHSGTIELAPTARLAGDVEAKTLIVREGARFDGRACIGRPSSESSHPRTEPRTPPRSSGPPRRRASA